jgi:hypothetical protein
MTALLGVTMLQYALLIVLDEAAVLTNLYGLLVVFPFYIVMFMAANFIPIILSAIFSALSAKLFFAGKNNWKQVLILLNYVAIISFAFSLPIQIFSYLPLPELTNFILITLSLVITFRAAGLAVSKTTKVTQLQGVLIYFSVTMVLVFALAVLAELVYVMPF